MTYLPRKGGLVKFSGEFVATEDGFADVCDGWMTVFVADDAAHFPPGTIFEPVEPSWFPPQRGDVAADADGRVARVIFPFTNPSRVEWYDVSDNFLLPDFRPVDLLARDGKRVRS